MSAGPDLTPPGEGAPFGVPEWWGSDPELCSPAELIDRIAGLEVWQNRIAAVQSAMIRSFARAHVAARTESGTVEPERLERDIVAQIGFACRVSPSRARTRVRMARDLHEGLDHVRVLFEAGELSAEKAGVVVAETAHLDRGERAEVDRRLAAESVTGMGVGTLRGRTRVLAAQVAPEKFQARAAAARSGRRVTLRPCADGMTDLVAHLPAEQGAACYAALCRVVNEVAVSPAPVFRGRGQVMADALVERVTGQVTAEDVGVQVQVLVPVEVLVDPDCPLPVEIPGHGPVPAAVLARTAGRVSWRRLVTRDGIVIGGDSRRRRFGGFLAELIRARDRYRCTESYCDAPIRPVDHIHRWADGGPTDFGNGRGLCAFHNYVREEPGWRVDRTAQGVRTTTPTGHTYVNSRVIPP